MLSVDTRGRCESKNHREGSNPDDCGKKLRMEVEEGKAMEHKSTPLAENLEQPAIAEMDRYKLY